MNTANTPSPNLAPPLWQLLLRAKTVVQQVRQGRSLSTALPPVPAELRAGVQALSFQTLRQMGRAQEVLARLAARKPHDELAALRCHCGGGGGIGCGILGHGQSRRAKQHRGGQQNCQHTFHRVVTSLCDRLGAR